MKKKMSMLLIICMLLTGCGSANQGKNISGTLSENTSNENSVRDSANVKFKYNKPQTEQISADIYNYVNAEVSLEGFMDLFSGDPSCEKETFPNGFREVYTFGGESGVILNRGGILQGINYHTPQGFNCLAVEDGTEYADETTEFDFSTRKEISEKLMSAVKELLGMDIKLKIDAVTAERFSKDVETHIKYAAQLYDDPPTADKYGTPADFYLVAFVQSIDGIPVEGRFGNAVFTANGMELLSVYTPVKSAEKVPAANAFIDLDGAEELLRSKYDMLFLDDPVEVESAELTYIISGGKLTPVWEFEIPGGITEYYDAYTGKEIVVSAGEGA